MTTDGADTLVAPEMQHPSATRRLLSAGLPALILGILSAGLCYLSAGASLGLFLGGLLMATILIAPLTVADERLGDRMIALAGVTLPIAVAWLIGTFKSQTYIGEWAACCALLITYGLALAGVSAALRVVRLPALAAAALTVTLGLAWMTWPIWLSRAWDGEASAAGVARLVVCHPGMAVNRQVIRQFGEWTGQSVAYHLTDLSQNVSYVPPRTVWPCVISHASLGAALLALAEWNRRRVRHDQLG
jgi:hypothetical protein